ncbi:hypothetical protein [Methylobacterium haplocladii]|uniref:hypothetical protein n=1 Tax=Methylobacterium haplocladii TaxID=1176176 RepID=UPI0011BDFE54|nr:hypothetical protein [Methylobacterium haplocladii]
MDLHAQIRTLVAEHDGNVSAAAEALGVSYMLLWRFEKSGSALARNLAAIRVGLVGLERAEDAQEDAAPRRKTKHKSEKIALLSQSDVARLKGMLHHLVRALDAYEAESSDPARTGSGRTPS